MQDYTNDYLLDKKVKIFQPVNGYRASTDAVFLSSILDENNVKEGGKILDVGSGTGAISLCLASRLKDKKVEIFVKIRLFFLLKFACFDILIMYQNSDY